MKLLYHYTLLLVVIVCFTTCKKDGASTTLPEATQEGKNTMGMKVNGEVWTPYAECGFGQNPCGAISLEYHTPYTKAYYLSFGGSRKYNGINGQLVVASITSIPLTIIGDKYDSLNISYTDYASLSGWKTYNKSSKSKGNFIITKLDFSKEIISGTFNCTLYYGNDSIVITDGRFDCKFRTCVCN